MGNLLNLEGSVARVMTINKPSILSAAFRVGEMVFAHGLPVQAVAGDFFRQYPFAPTFVCGRIEK